MTDLLTSELPGRVVFFPDASRQHPACVVRPRDTADVAATLRRAAGAGVPVVRGDG